MRNESRWQQLRELLSRSEVIYAARKEVDSVCKPISNMSPKAIWNSIIAQVSVVGNAKPGYRLVQSAAIKDLSIDALLGIPTTGRRVEHINKVLRSAGIRFVSANHPSTKAKIISALVVNPLIVEKRTCIFGQRVKIAIDRSNGDVELRRELLSWHIPGFGPKSTSDWLNNHLITNSLIAFDSQVCNMLCRHIGNEFSRECTVRLQAYEALEAQCENELSRPMNVALSEIDKRLFVANKLAP